MNKMNQELMDFQEFLFEVLYENTEVELIQSKLATYKKNTILANWVKSFDPAMMEVAARIVQHWCKRTS